jgi:hypothetical protein
LQAAKSAGLIRGLARISAMRSSYILALQICHGSILDWGEPPSVYYSMCTPARAMRRFSGIIVASLRRRGNCPRTLDFCHSRAPRQERRDYNHGSGGIMADRSGGGSDAVQRPTPNEKLVRVFDAEQESEVMVVRGLLDSQGIQTDITALDAPQDILPGVGGTIILVREEDAAKARSVIEEYRRAPGDNSDDLEITDAEASEDPAREG